MADQHEKGNGKVVRGRDERPPQSDDALVEDTLVDPGDDLADIRADDALLDALGGRAGEPPASLVDDELNALLLAWRREVDSPPMGELVDTETAVATIAAARPQPRSRHRFLIPLASAAAVLAIAFTGMSLVARDAQPGDALWGLTRVLYSEHARSVEAAVAVRTDLDTARAALRDGRYSEARDALLKAGEILPSVSPDDDKDALAQQHESLLEELTSTTPSPNTPTTADQATSLPLPTTEPSRPSSAVLTTVPEPTTTTTPTTTTETVPTTDGTAQPPPPPTSGEPPASGQSRGDPPQTPGVTDGQTQGTPEN
ncbi:anti-sigma-D factor RsdA-like protein [Saccharothrix carnea]|uniref:Anti-sigma-D factor RsdA-like protein n=1 Tax=Saccharothrix carnea TaxID=1280637 RepID=A0A2P8I8A9_SACCR|nr:anti-sigma-D factor RsdA [Saccharothrix carnea]PSL54715.1 anti-sigma-D factor RsdA-like protein [Saccharothrix carnea]